MVYFVSEYATKLIMLIAVLSEEKSEIAILPLLAMAMFADMYNAFSLGAYAHNFAPNENA